MRDLIKKILHERYIGRAEEDVEIRININNTVHADDRASQREFDDNEIQGIVEAGIEKLTIDIMHDRLDVDEEFVMQSGDLNVICILHPGTNFFTLDVITLIRDHHYTPYSGQYLINVDRGDSYRQVSKRRKRIRSRY
jgi:hypothetical protein